jgi:hypothetical protein
MNSKEGRELLEVIESFGELAWAKYQAKNPTFVVAGRAPWTEDRSENMPYTSFRFKREGTGLEEKIKEAVESYSGTVEWLVEIHDRIGFSGSRNWMISPRIKSNEKSISDATRHASAKDSGFSETAYKDIINLAAHVRAIIESQQGPAAAKK